MSPKRIEDHMILIVAHTANIGVLLDYLRGYGYKVLVASDGETALEIVEHTQPDIILLDVVLAGMDGFETCRHLKANPITRNIPVIFMTSVANTIDKVRGFALGAVDYVTKPIQSEEVLARLRTHLTIQSLQKSLEEKNAHLQEKIAESERLIAELNAFAHTVAHDLKDPLGIAINSARLLRKQCASLSTAELQHYADLIVQYAHTMNNIIEALLLLASVRTEEVELKPLDMGTIVAAVQRRLALLIEEHGAEVVTPGEWPVALGYAPWIEEVWSNYVSNAVKYGGRPPRLELGATQRGDGRVEFWIRDNGNGVTPEEQGRLFAPFTRLHHSDIDGHGLGLSIVQRILDKLGGGVGVASQGLAGQGSVFSFTLREAGCPQT
jgi:signal transduction histidine kinase